jgi:hypothetical protein
MSGFFLRHPRHLKRLNLVAAILLVLTVIVVVVRSGGDSASSQDSDEARVRSAIDRQALPVWNLLMASLDQARHDARTISELATHIFTNPESYRLSAQPSEYHYDETTGTYGSLRNDGLSVLVLSAATLLNPDILREIRLSEYLNPVLKATADSNSPYQQASLYTADSMVRSYPWIDFRSLMESGAMKRNFSVMDFSCFSKAVPSRNPRREAICEATTSGISASAPQIVCSSPFFSGEVFRGVIAIGIDASKTATQAFDRAGFQRRYALLLGRDDLLLGMSSALEEVRKKSSGQTDLRSFRDLTFHHSSLEVLLRDLPSNRNYGRTAGFNWLITSSNTAPVRLMTILPEAEVATLSTRLEGPLPPVWVFGGALGCGLLLVMNAWWIVTFEQNLRESTRKLSESFAALSDLNLSSAVIHNPVGLLSELYPKLNAGLQSLQKALETGRLRSESEASSGFPVEELNNRITALSDQVAILSCARVDGSLDVSFARLSAALRDIFSAQTAFFFMYTADGDELRASHVGKKEAEANGSGSQLKLKNGFLFEALVKERRIVRETAAMLSAKEQEQLALIQENLLAAPLQDEDELLGAVVLADKAGGFLTADQERLVGLQDALASTLKNLYQCEDLLKLDLQRREYCIELSKALTSSLDKIRREVQSIYSRLGKLTPYYRQHCETILFEIGKLYEIVREVREVELAGKEKPETRVP